MKIDLATVQHIANLARLELDTANAKTMMKDLNRILDWMEKLNELDTDQVEPLTHMSEEINMFRDDVVKPTLPREEGLRNAPQQDGTFFRVPKVIEAYDEPQSGRSK
ncbi:aspartyl-tRNA(Asn)/glutamyl-tRNA(Gln) amidotransferase subunit C [Catalinimonas alkaloidigena]|uniref:Aspartyl/glutamyl-tRNA(Asn/Gln) amidotransferase subunit C n=1 Tax=Catalinimonas alkaloidigena TaxID=1075417 RepID=A0A1G9GYN4_9BACT|nr:Asp-tRNA(Asn)/Glu-tRNA(Gln) amidotransferase subunit GatC [Catalinimonas alkaloidigena]SDL05715.1 aspartyl-tRNA(Asn)/glutamyl-tRNA(Gln) amidotransferase subunit C [Catalinimonas alkaloidigena]